MSAESAWAWRGADWHDQLDSYAADMVELVAETEEGTQLGSPLVHDQFSDIVRDGYFTLWAEFDEAPRTLACRTSRFLAEMCAPIDALGQQLPDSVAESHYLTLYSLIGYHFDPRTTWTELVVDWVTLCPWFESPGHDLAKWCSDRSDEETVDLAVGCTFLAARALTSGIID